MTVEETGRAESKEHRGKEHGETDGNQTLKDQGAMPLPGALVVIWKRAKAAKNEQPKKKNKPKKKAHTRAKNQKKRHPLGEKKKKK